MHSSQWSQQLMDSISTGICMIDSNYRVLYWNKYLEDYTDIAKEQIINHPLGNFFPLFNNDVYRERINSVFEGWPPVILSSRFHRMFDSSNYPKLHKKHQEVTISALLNEHECVYHALISVIDITDSNHQLEELNRHYKKAKEEIEFREKMQAKLLESEFKYRELNSTKDKLISIIAHDLKGPYSSLIGYLEILSNDSKPISPEKRKMIMDMLLDGTKQTYNLLENLLMWASTQINDGISFQPKPVFINDLIDDAVSKLNHIAFRKEIELNFNCNRRYKVFADVHMVKTILRNLISNAIKYSPKGETIWILLEVAENQLLKITIKDRGTGMDAHTVSTLFKMEKTHSVRGTENEKGTGLGLLVCKEFVTKHGGNFEIESTPGTGSSFSFTLPLHF